MQHRPSALQLQQPQQVHLELSLKAARQGQGARRGQGLSTEIDETLNCALLLTINVNSHPCAIAILKV